MFCSASDRRITYGLDIDMMILCRTPAKISDTTRRQTAGSGHHLVIYSHTRRRLDRAGMMNLVVKYPDSTKASLHWRLTDRARQRWPEITKIVVRHARTSATSTPPCPTAAPRNCAACVTPAPHTDGASPSTEPVTTTTQTPCSPPAYPPAPAKTPSTPPAASTSTTPPPGPNPRLSSYRNLEFANGTGRPRAAVLVGQQVGRWARSRGSNVGSPRRIASSNRCKLGPGSIPSSSTSRRRTVR